MLAQDGRPLYEDHPRHAVMPASTQKLIVAATAIAELGLGYRFHTLLAADAPPANGAIDGDLWLVGSGDPSLRTADLRAGAGALRRAGLHEVRGRVMVDASAIAPQEINPFWNPQDANADFQTAVSGISLDEDTVAFHVTGTTPGRPAEVRIDPPSRAVRASGEVITSGAGGDDVVIAAAAAPNTFLLSGEIPPGIEETYDLPVHGIARYAGAVFDRILRDDGIGVARRAGTGATPLATSVLWDHPSRPLRDLLRYMLYASDNHYAEQLMRTLGGLDGAPATDADGLNAERRFLRSHGIAAPGLHLVDGSGLAHANRVAAITLAEVLSYEAHRPGGNPLYRLLPRGDYDGTLKDYDFTAARGRVRAKSGTLADANALAGYVNTRHHGRLVFAFLVDRSPGDPVAAMVSAVDRLSRF